MKKITSCRLMVGQLGYTLIELMVAVAIMAVLTVAVVNVFLGTLVGGGKSGSLNVVRVNGDYTITQLERLIRGAAKVDPACTTVPVDSYDVYMPTGGIVNRINLTSGRIAMQKVLPLPPGVVSYLTASTLTASGLTFTCTSSAYSPETVKLQFTLSNGQGAKELVTQTFTTTVSLRTY